jgi:hypothetical protein
MKDKLERLSGSFVAGGYNMKRLFAETAVMCMGE